HHNYSFDYKNTGNLMDQVIISTKVRIGSRDQYGQYSGSYNAGGKYDVGYSRQFPNYIDSTNAFLLSEFGIIYPVRFPLSWMYGLLPDNINFTEISNMFWLSDFSYLPLENGIDSENWILSYENDRIVSITGSDQNTTQLIYSKP